MIEDVKVIPLKQIKDERGKIMHMLRSDSEIFEKFGEIYFSTINPGFVKGWHLHKEATLNYVCLKGKIKLALYKKKKKSKTFGKYQDFILSPENYLLIKIPPLIWNGFKSMHNSESIVANCLNQPHDEKEMIRRDPEDKYFNYNWEN